MVVNPFIIERAKGFYQLSRRANGFDEEDAAAMCAAFACELILKGLLEEAHGHNLSKLFNRLSDNRKAWLETRYQELESSNLVDDLSRCKSFFVDFRYIHEQQGFRAPIGLIHKLARFLIEVGGQVVANRQGRQFEVAEFNVEQE